ncbi:hypothetical protein MBRA_10560 [Mycobacterium branderi]|uniref:Uncharacterized protein n=1 Tax=Mycobacterium branderi TaxID=43348 RepID=A0ABM7KJ86_9MYCO|nr:hypothetical protein MBRA_10560 [Mycobacterium branderi]
MSCSFDRCAIIASVLIFCRREVAKFVAAADDAGWADFDVPQPPISSAAVATMIRVTFDLLATAPTLAADGLATSADVGQIRCFHPQVGQTE